MFKAEKTLALIDQVMEADGGNAFRAGLKELLPTMDDAYRQGDGGFRSHLGASLIGDECSRKLQLSWRWVKKKPVAPRLTRLFNRGHLEEARFLALLQMLPGVKVWACTEDGGQFKWGNFGGHFGSALDGVATGIPDVPNGAPCYCEFKTAASKSFKSTVSEGVACAHYEHYVQMQECMYHYNLRYALYMMVCKETDELYAEIVGYDENIAHRFRDRAQLIIFAEDPLPRLNNLPTFFKCKWCDFNSVCHGKELPLINCRTCAHWTPLPEGGYSCQMLCPEVLDKEKCQQNVCPNHMFHPMLLPAFKHLETSAEGPYIVLQDSAGNVIKHGPSEVTSNQLKERYDTK